MAAARRREDPGLSDLLFREPYRFNFFQAVRLLERLAHETSAQERQALRPVGDDLSREAHEAVLFRSQPSLSFPPSAVIDIRRPTSPEERNGQPSAPEMVVAFFGLTGPSGILPYHYTALLLRLIRNKNFSLRDFLDLFHHRQIALFYRAGVKYRLPFAYERSKIHPSLPKPDPITFGLTCLVGMGTAGLSRRLKVDDEAFLYYSGLFSHQPRSALSLERILEDYFGIPLRVQQFQGQWLVLSSGDQTLMPSPAFPNGLNNELGRTVVAGARVWDMQSKFRLRIGPLSYAEFEQLMPNGDIRTPLRQLSRIFAGPEYDIDVQVVLKREEVPWCRLDASNGPGAYLGWNTWIHTEEFPHDVDDTVFELERG